MYWKKNSIGQWLGVIKGCPRIVATLTINSWDASYDMGVDKYDKKGQRTWHFGVDDRYASITSAKAAAKRWIKRLTQ